MAALIADWNAAAEFWGAQMWAVLWQSTLIATAVAVISLVFLRRTSPGVRYWVWQIVALKLLVMPFWTYAIPLLPNSPGVALRELAESSGIALPDAGTANRPAEPRADVVSIAAANPLAPDASPPSPREEEAQLFSHDPGDRRAGSYAGQVTPLGWLLGIWGVVVAVQGIRILWQHRRLTQLLRGASAADDSLTALIRETAGRVGLRRAPRIVLTEIDCSPFVCGICRPVLVLPKGLNAALSANELNHVLLHELAHIRRLDLLWGWIGEMARMVYFFHPVVHWIAYRIRLERELACDQLAMSTSGQGAAEYAATLVRVVSQSSEPSVFKTAAASASLDGKSS
jgi:beta-lactamase regulating signal transducer with metallopeptidase domain